MRIKHEGASGIVEEERESREKNGDPPKNL